MVRAYYIILTAAGFCAYIFTVFRLTEKVQKFFSRAMRKTLKKILQFVKKM